jgi:hypothetical protein
MDDLLKDAIADAKAVRETALENAKIALEEAFTPRLQSMLAKKIQAEIEDEEGEDEMEMGEEDEDPADEIPMDEPEMDAEPEMDMGVEPAIDDEEEMEAEGVIEINGVKYAPIVSEEDEEVADDEDLEESDDLDLDEILKELDEEEGDDEEEEPVEESNDVSSGIGGAENKQPAANANDDATEDSESKGSSKAQGHENSEDKVVKEEVDEVDEDIDLEEIVKALSEEDEEEEDKEKVESLQSELDEHRNVVKYLRSKLNEVNLLNAKLLFTNKLFRSYGLNNDQKMKVVENFDRAHNLREVKLVYSTLAESFGSKQTKTEIKESKGSASKAVASTKSEKQEVIAEGHEMRDRFKKLAGIL